MADTDYLGSHRYDLNELLAAVRPRLAEQREIAKALLLRHFGVWLRHPRDGIPLVRLIQASLLDDTGDVVQPESHAGTLSEGHLRGWFDLADRRPALMERKIIDMCDRERSYIIAAMGREQVREWAAQTVGLTCDELFLPDVRPSL